MTLPEQSSGPRRLFDRTLLRQRRNRLTGAPAAEFLFQEAGTRLAERLADVRRRFATGLLLGARGGRLADLLPPGRIATLVQADLGHNLIQAAAGPRLVLDEEALPFGPERFDLILACASLHWVNDLPGTLAQIRYALRPDGLFLAALPGGRTLQELRQVLLQAEAEIAGGAAPRVAPLVDLRDAGGLLQRAGFTMPIADLETLTVTYREPLRLLADLRAMGETSCLADRPRAPMRRAVLARALALYRELHGDAAGRVPATFELVMLSGWKPDPSQPKAARRGSAAASLANAFGLPPEALANRTKL